MAKQILMYVPVLHIGYENFLNRHVDAQEIFIIGNSFRKQFRSLVKDIRALDPQHAAQYLRTRYPRQAVRVLETTSLPTLISADRLIVPDEVVMREIIASIDLPSNTEVTYDSTFLRWERDNSSALRVVTRCEQVSINDLDKRLLGYALTVANFSSDWWRQVGAIISIDGKAVLTAFNEHQPTEYAPYFNGDPRASFKRGINIELSTALHAEQGVIAEAARRGIPLQDSEIYVTTFPCPGCARLIAASGIATCYYSDDYAVLDGEEILKTAGVRLIWVDMKSPSSD